MLKKLAVAALAAITKKSRLELLAEVEEIIERDGESCAQYVAVELGIGLHEALSLIRSLCQAEGVFKGDKKQIGTETQKVQFYTLKRPRNTQGDLLPERVQRDELVAYLFGPAK
jgi:hypothetical protein